ncbi:MAG: hypothetical protein AB8I08_06810 [Sandaracinaceae bacterium]
MNIGKKPRRKNRGKTNRAKAKRLAKNRRRVQRMRGKATGRRVAKKW